MMVPVFMSWTFLVTSLTNKKHFMSYSKALYIHTVTEYILSYFTYFDKT